jgi:hypothetical protein
LRNELAGAINGSSYHNLGRIMQVNGLVEFLQIVLERNGNPLGSAFIGPRFHARMS